MVTPCSFSQLSCSVSQLIINLFFFHSVISSAERKWLQLAFEENNELHMVDFVPVETLPEVKRALNDTPLENIMIH